MVWCRCIGLGVETAAEHKVKKLVEQMKNGDYFLLQRNSIPGGLFAFINSVSLEEMNFHKYQWYTCT